MRGMVWVNLCLRTALRSSGSHLSTLVLVSYFSASSELDVTNVVQAQNDGFLLKSIDSNCRTLFVIHFTKLMLKPLWTLEVLCHPEVKRIQHWIIFTLVQLSMWQKVITSIQGKSYSIYFVKKITRCFILLKQISINVCFSDQSTLLPGNSFQQKKVFIKELFGMGQNPELLMLYVRHDLYHNLYSKIWRGKNKM